uniref:(northern house mosquito) hypothetical protein n=1 Tax=Culex pipiens TaxID=7175 RepID=A0A8D8P496_CULPI
MHDGSGDVPTCARWFAIRLSCEMGVNGWAGFGKKAALPFLVKMLFKFCCFAAFPAAFFFAFLLEVVTLLLVPDVLETVDELSLTAPEILSCCSLLWTALMRLQIFFECASNRF